MFVFLRIFERNIQENFNQLRIVLIFPGVTHRNLPSSWQQEISACNFVVHESFNPTTLENDIALIKLKRPAEISTHVVPACIPKYFENQAGVMLGMYPISRSDHKCRTYLL